MDQYHHFSVPMDPTGLALRPKDRADFDKAISAIAGWLRGGKRPEIKDTPGAELASRLVAEWLALTYTIRDGVPLFFGPHNTRFAEECAAEVRAKSWSLNPDWGANFLSRHAAALEAGTWLSNRDVGSAR